MIAPVILNATPLTNFALVGRPDLLQKLWPGNVYTTSDVLDEYQAGVDAGILPAGIWEKIPVIPLDEDDAILMQSMSARLGRGERSCIAVAHRRGGLLVTDDLDARRAARSLGVAITGSIGVLVACTKAGLITLEDGNLLLAEMLAAGFRSPVDTLTGFFKT